MSSLLATPILLTIEERRAITGQSHDYKRHGTTTLFAALDVARGKVIARHYKRRRRVEFLAFMNQIVTAYPEREIHVVLDNLSTHKPKHDVWLKRHKTVHFHYTPRLLAQPDRNLVLDPRSQIARRRLLCQRSRTHRPHRRVHRRLQSDRPPLRLDQIRGPPEAPQTMLRRPVIPGTSVNAMVTTSVVK